MKKKVRKMQLHKETLRQLEEPRLSEAAGGATVQETNCFQCVTEAFTNCWRCPSVKGL
jgi:hypothetical protein